MPPLRVGFSEMRKTHEFILAEYKLVRRMYMEGH